MSNAAKQASEARKAVEALKAELASIAELVEANGQHEAEVCARRQAGKASAKDLLEARQAAHQARELLKQQETDIAEAEVNLAQCEAEARREKALARIRDISDETRGLLANVDAQATRALEALARAMVPLAEAQVQHARLRDEWREEASHLGFNARDNAQSRAFFEHLRQHGVDDQPLRWTLIPADAGPEANLTISDTVSALTDVRRAFPDRQPRITHLPHLAQRVAAAFTSETDRRGRSLVGLLAAGEEPRVERAYRAAQLTDALAHLKEAAK